MGAGEVEGDAVVAGSEGEVIAVERDSDSSARGRVG